MVAPRALVFRPLVKGNEDSGNEIVRSGMRNAILRNYLKLRLVWLCFGKGDDSRNIVHVQKNILRCRFLPLYSSFYLTVNSCFQCF